MVPARLTLRNFLCYREPPESGPTVDFTGIRLACLTGENGNGKSALLDAITWALWGQARARTDDELIHLGRTEMEVELEFFSGEQTYRVIRKRKRGTQRSPGTTALEFHLASPVGWKPLTANHVRETQQRIRDILKLDYETFVNSAFLMQGRADAFTTKTPGDRKRILGEILGLSRYDDLEQQARYERGLRDEQSRALSRELEDIAVELSREPALIEEHSQLVQDLAALAADLKRSAEALEDLRQTEKIAAIQRDQLEQSERRYREAEGEVERARDQIQRRRDEVARHEELTRRAPEIEDGFCRLNAAIAADEQFGVRLQEHAGLERQQSIVEAQIALARSELTGREQLLTAELARLSSAVRAVEEIAGKRTELADRSARVQAEEARLRNLRVGAQELRDRLTELRTENAGLRSEMEQIKRKQTDLADATVCPLCRTELGEDGQAHIIAAYETDGRRLAAEYRDKRSTIESGESRIAELDLEIAALEPAVQIEQTTLARELGGIEGIVRAGKIASAALPLQEQSLLAVRASLSSGDYALAAAQQLRELEAKRSELNYARDAHEQAHQLVQQLRPFEPRHRELAVALSRLESERAALDEAERLLCDWQARAKACRAEVDAMRQTIAAIPQVAGRLAEAESRYAALIAQQSRHQQALGAVEQKLDDCSRKKRERSSKQEALKKAAEERGIYDTLGAAFSRRGIQALIIDHVIPEITDEANRLLARMTNNRLQVMMDTQRQTLRGSVVETLDIRIADELGTRNYELFSGGEAFRVNLALRIALSKLLARRAGAPLPTLVIDEGFGSQDAAALERLVEAINVIQSDFQCLLVITHLAELRDQFPVQIAVTKTAEAGSSAVVVQ
jgi:exonuclease SbcC